MSNRKQRVTADDIVMSFLLEGSSAVQALLVDHTSPTDVLSKAMQKIKAKNEHQDVTDLQDMRTAFLKAKGSGSRGAKALEVGTSKVYSTQRVGDMGDLFIRLPVSLLVSHKGAQVEVEACDDGTLRVRALRA
jgi:hypothetical protein